MTARKTLNSKTNVRAFWLKTVFAATAAVSPQLASRWLERLFLSTRRHIVPEREKQWLESAERSSFLSRGRELASWSWGDGPKVLLAHGWEGRGSQLAAFVDPIVTEGFQVVTFDAPGHGESPGSQSSLVEMADAVLDAANRFGPIHAVVAHSAGAAATTVALARGMETRRLVFLAPPTDLGAFLRQVAGYLGLSQDVAARTQLRIENRLGVRWDSLRTLAIAPTMTTPLLVFHDREDREVAIENGEALANAWPRARLAVTAGLGHRRILRDANVIERAVSFVSAGEEDPPRLMGIEPWLPRASSLY